MPTKSFYHQLADICADIAQVCLAVLVLPFIIGQSRLTIAVSGIIAAVFFWILALLITRQIKED